MQHGQETCYSPSVSWEPHHLALILLKMQNWWKNESVELSVEKLRSLKEKKNNKPFVSHCKVSTGMQMHAAVTTHIYKERLFLFAFFYFQFLYKKISYYVFHL